MMLEFSDGERFDTSGEFRIVEHKDGFYVLGNGKMIPINSNAEGRRLIAQLKLIDYLSEQKLDNVKKSLDKDKDS